MEFPHGHHSHHHHNEDDDHDRERQPYPPPPFDQPPPPKQYPPANNHTFYESPPNFTHTSHAPQPPPPNYMHTSHAPQPPPPNHMHSSHAPQPPPPNHMHTSHAPQPPPPNHMHTSHAPQTPPPNYMHTSQTPQPPPPNYMHTSHAPPAPAAASSVTHHWHKSDEQPFSSGFVKQHSHYPSGTTSLPGLSNRPTFRVYCKANTNYALAVRDGGKLILEPFNPADIFQQWYKDEKYSTRVKDGEGHPCFSLVNKATGLAMKHSDGDTQPVQLTPYNPDVFDMSVLWTESKDLVDGYRAVRMVNDIRLNLDAYHGNKESGGVHDGTIVVLWQWNNGDNQLWKITSCKFLYLLLLWKNTSKQVKLLLIVIVVDIAARFLFFSRFLPPCISRNFFAPLCQMFSSNGRLE